MTKMAFYVIGLTLLVVFVNIISPYDFWETYGLSLLLVFGIAGIAKGLD